MTENYSTEMFFHKSYWIFEKSEYEINDMKKEKIDNVIDNYTFFIMYIRHVHYKYEVC